jgi:hypothetical protein
MRHDRGSGTRGLSVIIIVETDPLSHRFGAEKSGAKTPYTEIMVNALLDFSLTYIYVFDK